MTDAYANENHQTFEFHDLCLWLEREHEWIFTARFEGVTIMAATNPDPTPEEIIDELLHKAKEARNHPSRNIERRQVEQTLDRYQEIASNLPEQKRNGDPSVLLEEMGDEEALREFRRKRMIRNVEEGDC